MSFSLAITDIEAKMTDAPQDEARLHATEAQMRRALGLDDRPLSRPDPEQTTSLSSQHRQRRFVRDGEVPVTVIHRDESGGINQLEVARETIQSLTAAQEELERSLTAAQETIRDLQTKLAHERIARDEAMKHFASDKHGFEQALQSVRAELEAEHHARQQAEERLAEALRGQAHASAQAVSPVPERPTSRRRGRSPKVEMSESDFVEWWKPGWQERYR
jgi:chromosome segregation ATPase